jgi:hypothetical protein
MLASARCVNHLFLRFFHPGSKTPLSPQAQQISSLFPDPSCSGPLVVDIPTIERLGGGSMRCMLCELF